MILLGEGKISPTAFLVYFPALIRRFESNIIIILSGVRTEEFNERRFAPIKVSFTPVMTELGELKPVNLSGRKILQQGSAATQWKMGLSTLFLLRVRTPPGDTVLKHSLVITKVGRCFEEHSNTYRWPIQEYHALICYRFSEQQYLALVPLSEIILLRPAFSFILMVNDKVDDICAIELAWERTRNYQSALESRLYCCETGNSEQLLRPKVHLATDLRFEVIKMLAGWLMPTWSIG